MESKAMLPDSTQSETLPPATSSMPDGPSGTIPSSSASTSQPKQDDDSASKKKKKRKSDDKSTKSFKKKKAGKAKARKEQKSKKSKNAKKPELEDPDSDLDPENDPKPIRDYVKDREDMLQHMFKCVIKANKLQAMLPDILKNVPVEELQHLCLLQLEGMSKSRIMSILAGEEMQSSSDEEESDLEMEKNRPKMGDVTDELINSEVVDSTSSLPQAVQAVDEAEESVSVQQDEEEAPGTETDAEEVEYEEADSNVSVDGSWQNESDRGQQYSDEDVPDEMEYSRQESDSVRELLTDEEGDGNIQDEEASEARVDVVQKVKKFRRVKIIRAEGEECEEGEITSDEVETDEESVMSDKEPSESIPEMQDDCTDRKSCDARPGTASNGDSAMLKPSVPSEGNQGDVEGSLPNSGNQENDANHHDDSVDVDDSNADVVVNVANVQVISGFGNTLTGDDTAITDNDQSADAVDQVQTVKNVAGDTLNIFAEEDNLELASDKSSTHEVEDDIAENESVDESTENTDSNLMISAKDPDDSDDKNSNVRTTCDNQENPSRDVNAEKSEPCVESTKTVEKLSAPPQNVKGAADTASKMGRKVTQELEVLELELRARAIRSLMKRYGKDVG